MPLGSWNRPLCFPTTNPGKRGTSPIREERERKEVEERNRKQEAEERKMKEADERERKDELEAEERKRKGEFEARDQERKSELKKIQVQREIEVARVASTSESDGERVDRSRLPTLMTVSRVLRLFRQSPPLFLTSTRPWNGTNVLRLKMCCHLLEMSFETHMGALPP